MSTRIGKPLRVLALTAGVALGIAPAAHAEHSITVSSAPGAVSRVSEDSYRVEFTTTAESTQPCRNWADASDARVVAPSGERYQASPDDRSSTANADNSSQSSVEFRWAYDVPPGSRVTFASRVGCDTVTHIGADATGNTVTVDVPAAQRVCGGSDNRIDSVVTPSGSDRGLAGTQLYVGQRVVATETMKIRLGDGSSLMLSKGDAYEVTGCAERTFIDVICNTLTRLASGSTAKFEVWTPRAVTGVRGTRFTVRYEQRRQRTTVTVSFGKVIVRARKGSAKKVVAGRGQAVVQVGRKAPRIVRR